MKRWISAISCGVVCLAGGIAAQADSTIDPAHPYAYGANLGWMDARAEETNGAVIGQWYCTGYVWMANAGWICLGRGPTNGWQYSNASATDWGVNHDGQGGLSGYAWAPNLGWVTFEQTYGQPRVNLATGTLYGSVWCANAGWISLSNAQAYVRTVSLASGPDTDADTIPDAWEYRHTNTLAVLTNGACDCDSDGAVDVVEYGAGTDPFDPSSRLRITAIWRADRTNWLQWACEPTRFYRLQRCTILSNGAEWTDSGLGTVWPEGGGTLLRGVEEDAATQRFYRIRADVPLSP